MAEAFFKNNDKTATAFATTRKKCAHRSFRMLHSCNKPRHPCSFDRAALPSERLFRPIVRQSKYMHQATAPHITSRVNERQKEIRWPQDAELHQQTPVWNGTKVLSRRICFPL